MRPTLSLLPCRNLSPAMAHRLSQWVTNKQIFTKHMKNYLKKGVEHLGPNQCRIITKSPERVISLDFNSLVIWAKKTLVGWLLISILMELYNLITKFGKLFAVLLRLQYGWFIWSLFRALKPCRLTVSSHPPISIKLHPDSESIACWAMTNCMASNLVWCERLCRVESLLKQIRTKLVASIPVAYADSIGG